MMYTESYEVMPVVDWLQKYTSAVERTGQDRWQFKLNRGLDLTGMAVLDHDWLRMSIRLGEEQPEKLLDAELLEGMLLQNSTLPGGVKFCLDQSVSQAHLAVEIPVGEEDEAGAAWLDAWIGEACASCARGLEVVGPHGTTRGQPLVTGARPTIHGGRSGGRTAAGGTV